MATPNNLKNLFENLIPIEQQTKDAKDALIDILVLSRSELMRINDKINNPTSKYFFINLFTSLPFIKKLRLNYYNKSRNTYLNLEPELTKYLDLTRTEIDTNKLNKKEFKDAKKNLTILIKASHKVPNENSRNSITTSSTRSLSKLDNISQTSKISEQTTATLSLYKPDSYICLWHNGGPIDIIYNEQEFLEESLKFNKSINLVKDISKTNVLANKKGVASFDDNNVTTNDNDYMSLEDVSTMIENDEATTMSDVYEDQRTMFDDFDDQTTIFDDLDNQKTISKGQQNREQIITQKKQNKSEKSPIKKQTSSNFTLLTVKRKNSGEPKPKQRLKTKSELKRQNQNKPKRSSF